MCNCASIYERRFLALVKSCAPGMIVPAIDSDTGSTNISTKRWTSSDILSVGNGLIEYSTDYLLEKVRATSKEIRCFREGFTTPDVQA
jgi:hypothetical protein